MPTRDKLKTLAWLLAAAGLAAASAQWILSAHTVAGGRLALAPFALSAALLATLILARGQRRNSRTRYRARHKPLAGPRPGAELPG